MTSSISISEWTRLLLLYAHLLVSMLAIAQVFFADLGIATSSLSRVQLHRTIRGIGWLLAGLWITGLMLIGLDTGFDLAVMAEKPKLLFKLVVVLALTLNGLALHSVVFPILMSDSALRRRQVAVMAVFGAMSSLHWLLAAFIGVTKPLNRLPIETLLAAYAALCFGAVIVALCLAPMARKRIEKWRQASDQVETGKPSYQLS